MDKNYMDLAKEELEADINKAASAVGKRILIAENESNKRLKKLAALKEELTKAEDVNDVKLVSYTLDKLLGE